MTQTDPELLEMIAKTARDSQAWSLEALTDAPGPQQVMFLNAHAVTSAARDMSFRRALLGCDYLLRDGIGLELGLKMLKLGETENLNGTDLIPKILARLKDRSIAVWGSSEEALAKLKARLEGEGYGQLVSFEHGFHADEFYLERYRALQPEILVLCMGMPRQELLTGKLVSDGAAGLIISGGGWANFYSGHIARAPLWMQRMKLEWLHRLSREPMRLGKRYTVDILAFFLTLRRLKAQR